MRGRGTKGTQKDRKQRSKTKSRAKTPVSARTRQRDDFARRALKRKGTVDPNIDLEFK
jgi:hypothetical protein